ncbi:MAG: EAL domain-containing protein [Acidimicrobiales bacterium]|nr:EAL domain-containing protein [Acidimicrobiales bacterium]
MRTFSPTTDDLFIAKKGRVSRGLARAMLSHRATHSDRSARMGELEAEQQREQREQLIRVTIADRSFETHFQPIVDLRSGQPVGAEALSRFAQLPVRAPDAWFAAAASVGLGVELELAALDMALEQLHLLPSNLYLSLNASVETIMSEQFGASLAGIPAERIVLELTEHTRVDDYQKFEQSIEAIRSKGVRLAVDDAGAGYSSLQHILNLQPDVIKLDIGLTRGIDKDPARRALGRALLTFGLDAYKASIVAEGIETEGEFETLRALGCPLGQGYFLGRPGRMPAKRPASAGSTLALLPSPNEEVASPLLWPRQRTGFDGQVNEVAERLAAESEQSKTA